MTLFLFSLPAYAEQPMDVLQRAIDEGLHLLKKAQKQPLQEREASLERLWEILNGVFDFKEFSKLALGRNWRRFTVRQREEFIDVFSDFVRKVYFVKALEKYKDETVMYVGQELIDDRKARVKIKVVLKGVEIPATVRMFKRDLNWKAYDVTVLGISAVKIYRVQFNHVLRKDSPAQLIKRIRHKGMAQKGAGESDVWDNPRQRDRL
jgi:phospholipid transport system substrate-binding protein